MPDNLLRWSALSEGLSAQSFFLCTVASIFLGIVTAFLYMYRNSYSKNFVLTLAILPLMVQTVILLVNGNLGTGVAVMGAFGLVRFRSVLGSAREIGSIFTAMAIGLATGTGYLTVAVLFVLLVGAVNLVLIRFSFGEPVRLEKDLKILIPESLDYTEIFDDLFSKYTVKAELIFTKTTNMGSFYELHYRICMKNRTLEKEFLDALRCRNGNLTISCGRDLQRQEL